MTYISVVCRKVGSIIISKISSDDDYKSINFYTFNPRLTIASKFISELQMMIDPYDTEIMVVNFDECSSIGYMNQIYGSLITLKLFGTVNRVRFINDNKKLFKRIYRYVGVGKGRCLTRDCVSDVLLETTSCSFYTKSIEINIANKPKQLYNLHRMSIVALFYMLIKNRLQGKDG